MLMGHLRLFAGIHSLILVNHFVLCSQPVDVLSKPLQVERSTIAIKTMDYKQCFITIFYGKNTLYNYAIHLLKAIILRLGLSNTLVRIL